jgi:hypothetical protein
MNKACLGIERNGFKVVLVRDAQEAIAGALKGYQCLRFLCCCCGEGMQLHSGESRERRI